MHHAQYSGPAPDKRLIDSLATADAFPHPADDIEIIETHISWLILAGDHAYKIKKPLVLDFLDFGTLEKRRHYCLEELRLNRAWAPAMYLDVVPVTVSGGRARFGGAGEPVEFALHMRRFAQDRRLDAQLEAGKLTAADARELADAVARRHAKASRAPADRRSRVLDLTARFMFDNFEVLAGQVSGSVFADLHAWTRSEILRCNQVLAARFDDGFVRECHGDLHLSNLVRLDDGIKAFDCIEFSADLRQIDVICDIAFLVMDFAARGRPDLGSAFLNRYLEATGDYRGMQVFRLFFVYRCLVRAKVAVIRSQERSRPKDRDDDLGKAQFYCELAAAQVARLQPRLVVMHGLSGVGKTRVSDELLMAMPAIRVRSDVERKRLHGLAATARSDSPVGGGLYTKVANREVYARLRELAAVLLEAGYNVILDAAFLKAEERNAAIAVAREKFGHAVIVEVTAPDAVLLDRIRVRARDRGEASEADVEVLEYQQSQLDPIGDSERQRTITCDNGGEPDIASLVSRTAAW